ncbi:Radical SAM domain protein [Thioalkalivibrio sp. K90mix]|jgi:radical SAM/Cys-rich protein|uniref:arsenosugar biosynthesis radical SAM (seleno)protein ArsS n=1 Tax=Thioalkalivibrio sp. (strain K90mix) TaxID=396595 RepID=UPI000195A741|nr:arsenosugar biosynthesis radical SAM (seleno)protein ArsS [Thioalkalivibrio sp. K90mix]ADC72254.1 Radical SAM domain protein [Thioalkalivibrio sp. K90mix]
MSQQEPLIAYHDFPPVTRDRLETLQANLGYVCNQTCFHCHVNAGPNRREVMPPEVIDELLACCDRCDIRTLDLTGGAPELNPGFRALVRAARQRGIHVIDRCNLTILGEPGQEDLAAFLAEQGVEVVASLPCYLEENVDAQRGDGVFERSIAGLKQLNALGYGQPGRGLALNLVYNPQGPSLPPPQAELEAAYHEHLERKYGIRFNALFTITNMPIHRFAKTLAREGRYNTYMQTLRNAHQSSNLAGVMCRTLVSVDWQGYVHDCDFNQMLELPLGAGRGGRVHIAELTPEYLAQAPIAVADHCYGCTAGQGSSCGGAL